jgi:hypothetical protein
MGGGTCYLGATCGLGGATGGLLVAELLPNPDDLEPDDDLPPPLGILYLMIFKLLFVIVHLLL